MANKGVEQKPSLTALFAALQSLLRTMAINITLCLASAPFRSRRSIIELIRGVLVFDYSMRVSGNNINQCYGAKKFIETWKKHHSGELFRFSTDEDKIELFLKQSGLKLLSSWTMMKLRKRFY